MLPLGLMVAMSLLAVGWKRGALAWALVVPGVLAAVVFGKMFVDTCGTLGFMPGLKSPSGHTASAAVVYGGLIALLLPEPQRGARRPFAALVLAAVFAVLFGGTRLWLHVHTRSDVVAGACLGMAGALALARLAGPRPPRLRVAMPLAAALFTVMLFHGEHLHAEARIARLSHLVWPLTLCVVPATP
jgi:membrane-associated phospholipid phosphatase